MLRVLCRSKIHRATVTAADLNYMGSITIDAALLDAAGMVPYERVTVTNCANGTWWETYIIAGPRGQGDVCLNGPPARHFQPGDPVIIMAYAMVPPEEFSHFRPVIVFVDQENKITTIRHDEDPFRTDP